jgi:hypothetical protein
MQFTIIYIYTSQNKVLNIIPTLSNYDISVLGTFLVSMAIIIRIMIETKIKFCSNRYSLNIGVFYNYSSIVRNY